MMARPKIFRKIVHTTAILTCLLGCVAVFLFAPDLFAWGVPGAAEPGTGSGPGGGSHSGGVPAPFGALFLGTGTLMAAWSKQQTIRKLKPAAALMAMLALAVWAQWLEANHALLFAVPMLALSLKASRTQPTVRWPTLIGLVAISTNIFYPMAFTPLMALSIFIFIFHFDTTATQKTFFAFVLGLALLAAQPFWAPVNHLLQTVFATSATWWLNVLGYSVWLESTSIYGMTTTINVTQACVGINIIATTAALSWFLSYCFAPKSAQGILCLGMIAVATGLNFVRIIGLSLMGHFFAELNFLMFHDVMGWAIAFLTYAAMGGLLWLNTKNRAATRGCNG
jgi:exosortase/archaeosortase family protein